MIKVNELESPNSCLNKANDAEMIFVLRAHDYYAGDTIRYWVSLRVANGKNTPDDPEIIEALACADTMDIQNKEGM